MTEIEQGYIAQGYELPPGWTWEDVASHRAKYGVDGIYVPLACGPGCVQEDRAILIADLEEREE